MKKNINFIYPILFLFFGILVYPLYILSISPSFGYAYFKIFSLSTLSLTSLFFILLNPEKLLKCILKNIDLALTVILFFSIPVIHFFYFETYQLTDFGFSIIWFSIPLFCLLFHEQFKKILPYFILILWILDLIHSCNRIEIGIAGNKNWQAILSLVFIIYSFYFAKSILRTKLLKSKLFLFIKILLISILSLLSLFTLFIIWKCDSRGTYLAAVILILFLLFISIKEFVFNKKYAFFSSIKKAVLIKLFIIVTICILICMLTLTVLIKYSAPSLENIQNNSFFEEKKLLHANKIYNKMEEAFNEDVRIPLWIGTLNMALNNSIIGVGATRYETVFAEYRPLSYFLKPNSATRTNHPHNSILYILACFGIPGFVFWTILCIYPMIYCFTKYNTLALFEKVSLLSYLVLFIHSCFDLIFYVWPTLLLSMIFLGILWRITWNSQGKKNITIRKKNLLKFLILSCGVILAAFTAHSVYKETVGSYFLRTGYYFEENNNKNTAINYYKKGLEYILPPRFIYKASLIALNDLQDPLLALKLFSYYKFIPTNNYAHNNAFIAECLIKMGKLKPALPYLYKEVVNYPLSTSAWHRLYQAQSSLGYNTLAKYSYSNMLTTLKYKNLPQSSLKLLLLNPEYDKHPHKIPDEMINELKLKK